MDRPPDGDWRDAAVPAVHVFDRWRDPVAVIGWTRDGDPLIVDHEGDVRVANRDRIRLLEPVPAVARARELLAAGSGT